MIASHTFFVEFPVLNHITERILSTSISSFQRKFVLQNYFNKQKKLNINRDLAVMHALEGEAGLKILEIFVSGATFPFSDRPTVFILK